ncbi:molybdate ABC transporter substrate-binding protein [Sulfitobacter sp. SK012]|uniref:molybdate ABC transporter substrate-binding protein n=1 Tax=Sulfitobacter sp. SK012 TaxID=1389005 RepID=UPI000E0AAA9D|nr:molybdate ABC transporter substrate-binding protein [Sulfitobacter sp. SK012]AXI45743.1 molybdate ABC transporter substrate-binding protein [Sulfitobacter sp. SK012]
MKRLLIPQALMLLTALPAGAQGITVFAAASLRGALEEIATNYASDVTLSFGGSGTIARQIAAGAPADAVILASAEWADWLEANALLRADTRRDVAGNTLVVIGPAGTASATAQSALAQRPIAMGQRDAVPAGSYAREWLQTIDLWTTIEPHLAETDNVRAALALVAQGAAPVGIVYASDAVAEPRVAVTYSVPLDQHAPIRYPAASLTPVGDAFAAYLAGPEATAVFTAHGFVGAAP